MASDDHLRRDATAPPATDEAARLWGIGRAAWPGLTVEPERFAAFLAERPATDDRAADLYLACACAAGDREAHAAFTRAHRPLIERALRRLAPDAATADDLTQSVCAKLLLDGGEPPRIQRYSGRGPLAAWVVVVASRVGYDALRRAGRAPKTTSSDLLAGDAGHDAELAYMKRTYREALERAIEETLASMSTRARLMLRYHAADGLSIDAIARLQGVHRATAARWLVQARADLVRMTRARLMRAAGLSESEADSVHRLVISQLDISLDRLLASSSA